MPVDGIFPNAKDKKIRKRPPIKMNKGVSKKSNLNGY
jgi:hypothetical protein